MECTDNPGCVTNVIGAKAAAAVVGWKVKVVPYQLSNPASLVTGMKTALQYHPVAVFPVGIPQADWASVIPSYTAAHVAIIPEAIGEATLSKTVITSIPSGGDLARLAKGVAAWIAVNSKGKGHVMLMNFPEQSGNAFIRSGLTDELKAVCPGCSLAVLNLTLAQLGSGQTNQTVATHLRENPSVQYVVADNGAYVNGLRSVLNSGGLSQVKITGVVPSASNLSNVKSGSESAWTAYDQAFQSWLGQDAALRFSEGMTIPAYTGVIPELTITSANVGTLTKADMTVGYSAPYDYRAAFAKLWRVTS
jgi:hypothetical protein